MRQDLGRMKAFSPGWLENQVCAAPYPTPLYDF